MENIEEGKYYLVWLKMQGQALFMDFPVRIAKFNGFGEDKGWGGMDWSGDSGHSTDSWMHSDVDMYIPLSKLSFHVDQRINGATNLITSVDYKFEK